MSESNNNQQESNAECERLKNIINRAYDLLRESLGDYAPVCELYLPAALIDIKRAFDILGEA